MTPGARQIVRIRRLGEAAFWVLLGAGLILLRRDHLWLGLTLIILALVTLHLTLGYPGR